MKKKTYIPERTSRRIRADIRDLREQFDYFNERFSTMFQNLRRSADVVNGIEPIVKKLAHIDLQHFTLTLNSLLNSMDNLSAQVDALHRLRAKQDQQLSRMIELHLLMLKRMERFYAEKVEPGVVESIHKDLKTPTLLLTS